MRLSAHASSQDLDPSVRPDWVSAGDRRRMDPLTLRACQCVDRCLAGRRLDAETAVIFACAYGSITSTLRFADSMAAFGDGSASPTPFTSSVHNATCGTLSQLLGLHGPSTTISEGNVSVSAALRWAHVMLGQQRCSTVLVVAGEEHQPWSQRTISELTDLPWLVTGGMAAVLLENGAAGRELRPGEHLAEQCLDSGGMTAGERRRLARAADRQQRLVAPELLGGWWPTCLLSALPSDGPALQLRERDGLTVHSWWLGPGSLA